MIGVGCAEHTFRILPIPSEQVFTLLPSYEYMHSIPYWVGSRERCCFPSCITELPSGDWMTTMFHPVNRSSLFWWSGRVFAFGSIVFFLASFLYSPTHFLLSLYHFCSPEGAKETKTWKRRNFRFHHNSCHQFMPSLLPSRKFIFLSWLGGVL